MKNLNKETFTKSSTIYPICLLLFFWGLSSCGPDKNEAAKAEDTIEQNRITLTEAQYKNAAIKTGMSEKKSISNILKINGNIELPPQNIISISIPLGGYLKSTQLLPGTQVKKGQVLAFIEDTQFIQLQQEFLVTQAKLNFAQQEQNRQRELNKYKAGSDKALQLAETEYKSLKIMISALAEKLRLIGIKPESLTEDNMSRQLAILSPINGYVSKVNGNIGTYFNPSDVLVELIDPSDVHLTLSVFERDLAKLSMGQKVFAFTNNNPEKRHEAKINLISRDLSPERTAEIHCHFEQFDKSLTPGMYMNAEIMVKLEDVQAVPEKSIVAFEGKNYIFIEKGEREFEMREISIGDTGAGYTAIESNIEGHKIALEGAYSLLMQLKNIAEE